MKTKKINILFCGARWLGIRCLWEILKNKDCRIAAAVVPQEKDRVWWKDVNDWVEAKKTGIELNSWKEAQKSSFDLVFSVYHRYIFKKEFIDKIPLGIINLHPMPLPNYRGKNGPAHAIINREKNFGATLHYIDEGVDTGPVISRCNLPITFQDTGFSLYQKTQKAALRLFKNNLPKIISFGLSGKKTPSYAQNEKLACYYPQNSLENKEVDLNNSWEKIYNFVRALQFPPFEPAYFLYKGKKIHLKIDSGKIVLNGN